MHGTILLYQHIKLKLQQYAKLASFINRGIWRLQIGRGMPRHYRSFYNNLLASRSLLIVIDYEKKENKNKLRTSFGSTG